MHSDANVLTGKRQAFAKIKPGSKLPNRLTALLDLFQISTIQQPRGKRALTGAGTRRAKQFKKTAFAKQIEITRIGMRQIEKLLASLSRACPPVFNARHSLFAEPPQSLAPSAGSNHTLVPDKQRNQQHDRNENIGNVCGVVFGEPDRGNDGRQADCNLGCCKEIIPLLMPRDRAVMSIDSRSVFVSGTTRGHSSIIARRGQAI